MYHTWPALTRASHLILSPVAIFLFPYTFVSCLFLHVLGWQRAGVLYSSLFPCLTLGGSRICPHSASHSQENWFEMPLGFTAAWSGSLLMNAEAAFLSRWTSQSPAKGRDGLLLFCLNGDGHRQRCNKDSRESQNIIEHVRIWSVEKENKGDVEL